MVPVHYVCCLKIAVLTKDLSMCMMELYWNGFNFMFPKPLLPPCGETVKHTKDVVRLI